MSLEQRQNTTLLYFIAQIEGLLISVALYGASWQLSLLMAGG